MLKASAFAVVLAFGAVSSLVAAEGGKPQQQRTGLFGAYYYPWYYAERWTNEPVADTPRLGFYSSDDVSVAARHVEWAKKAGLDFFMVSWINPEGREDR